MDSREVLEFVDEVFYAKKGKRLSDLQRGIIEGTLKRQKYSEIADNYHCEAVYAKEVGYELWRMLSEIFGETVDKKHLQSILERQLNQNIIFADSNVNSNILGSGCIINNPDSPNPTPDKSQPVTPDLQQQSNNQTKIEKVEKLRQFGLSDEQIAEILELSLEVVQQVELEA